MKSLLKTVLVVVVCAALVSACAKRTEVQQIPIDQIRANLNYENVIFRNFTANPDIKAPEGPLMECRNSAVDYLQLKKVYNKVEKDSGMPYTGSTMYVDVNVTSLRIVGGAARFWAGALAGRSNMNMDVTLMDKNGTVIAQKELIGAPNAFSSSFTFANADYSLPQKMGFLLGDFILAHSTGK
ncbi:MAG: hypothetical protein JW736_04970 [Deltaproteobacteria bacterium]|nr:hypothetical protein [Deltaproteobacteria bacterium]